MKNKTTEQFNESKKESGDYFNLDSSFPVGKPRLEMQGRSMDEETKQILLSLIERIEKEVIGEDEDLTIASTEQHVPRHRRARIRNGMREEFRKKLQELKEKLEALARIKEDVHK